MSAPPEFNLLGFLSEEPAAPTTDESKLTNEFVRWSLDRLQVGMSLYGNRFLRVFAAASQTYRGIICPDDSVEILRVKLFSQSLLLTNTAAYFSVLYELANQSKESNEAEWRSALVLLKKECGALAVTEGLSLAHAEGLFVVKQLVSILGDRYLSFTRSRLTPIGGFKLCLGLVLKEPGTGLTVDRAHRHLFEGLLDLEGGEFLRAYISAFINLYRDPRDGPFKTILKREKFLVHDSRPSVQDQAAELKRIVITLANCLKDALYGGDPEKLFGDAKWEYHEFLTALNGMAKGGSVQHAFSTHQYFFTDSIIEPSKAALSEFSLSQRADLGHAVSIFASLVREAETVSEAKEDCFDCDSDC